MINRLRSTDSDFQSRLRQLLAYEPTEDAAVEVAVAQILRDIRQRGDTALIEYTQRFDRNPAASPAGLEISKDQLHDALNGLDQGLHEALHQAAQRVRDYHEHQKAISWEFTDALGNRLGQQITPLDRVGLYVPGGKAFYPSSVLMNALPAKVAGVGELIMVSPAMDGIVNPLVLAAAAVAGVDRVFMVGGAQAVAALAYGTETIPKVDKIVGPGNAYVAEAKRRVFGTVGIDMIAGPSEILIIADGSVDPDWAAMDLFSQAEHDEMAQSILLSPDAAYLDAVQSSLARLLDAMPRKEVIGTSLRNRGMLIQTHSIAEACELSNQIAPEHLEVLTQQPRDFLPLLKHAGAIFLGPYASESLGDYCAGPNHVLPTMRTARFSSPLGVYDFQKRSSLIEISAAGAQALGPIAAKLAYGENLQAHARSAEMRLS